MDATIGEFKYMSNGECETCGKHREELILASGYVVCLDCEADAIGHGREYDTASDAVDAFEQATGRKATGRQMALIMAYY